MDIIFYVFILSLKIILLLKFHVLYLNFIILKAII